MFTCSVILCLNWCVNVNSNSDRVRVKSEKSKLILIKGICRFMHEMASVSISHSRFNVYITVHYICVYLSVYFLRATPTSSPHNMDAFSKSVNLLQFALCIFACMK